jgi:1,4-alpha-glucan branching enzyme
VSKEKKKKKAKRIKWTFSLEAAEANEVRLMGDFNNWNPAKHPMKRDKYGMWNKAVMLSPGNYEYNFLVDGQWREDPRNDHLCTNCFGTCNNVINLPKA